MLLVQSKFLNLWSSVKVIPNINSQFLYLLTFRLSHNFLFFLIIWSSSSYWGDKYEYTQQQVSYHFSHGISSYVSFFFFFIYLFEFVQIHHIIFWLYRLLRAEIKLKMNMQKVLVMLFVYPFWYAICNNWIYLTYFLCLFIADLFFEYLYI